MLSEKGSYVPLFFTKGSYVPRLEKGPMFPGFHRGSMFPGFYVPLFLTRVRVRVRG